MADLSEMLAKVMSDPGAMQQISALAQNLGLQGTPQAPPTPPAPPPPPQPAPGFGNDPAALMNALLQMSQRVGGDQRQIALFNALRPFLRPERAKRLDIAIQVARMSLLAGSTLQGMSSSFRQGR